LVTSAPIVGQAWRDGSRQVSLARLLKMVNVVPTDQAAAMRAGELLANAAMSDVVDALIVGLAVPGDQILTSDPGDLVALVQALGIPAKVITI
jgi:hypothetical protein